MLNLNFLQKDFTLWLSPNIPHLYIQPLHQTWYKQKMTPEVSPEVPIHCILLLEGPFSQQ